MVVDDPLDATANVFAVLSTSDAVNVPVAVAWPEVALFTPPFSVTEAVDVPAIKAELFTPYTLTVRVDFETLPDASIAS